GGICTDGGDGFSYSCNCSATGFTGTNCDVGDPPNACDATPCQNGGACTDGGDGVGYTCDCTGTGYTGLTCDTINACNTAPCQNGGVCNDAGDGTNYSCDCTDTGFSGPTCETVNACHVGPCQNGGICTDGGDGFSYSCNCSATGFGGPNCVNACDAAPCQNGGVCDDAGDGLNYTCDCTGTGFEGTDCETGAPNFLCEPTWAGCTEADFDANDLTGSIDPINITIQSAGTPYSPKCIRVAVGQQVTIEAAASHPFMKQCAEDAAMDAADGQTTDVTITLTSPGYYNYRCLFHAMMVGNIQVVE
ncbi:MAG: cupredoxin domain-containing protein, partial [Myxococcota bacterium]